MRKVLLILVMLMSVAMLAAATSATVGGDTTSGSAEVKIVLPLNDSEEFGQTIVVGFSTTEVSESSAPTAPANDEIELVKATSGNAAELTTGLHVYWQTNDSDANFTLKLYQENALTSTSNNTIDWKVTASNDTLNKDADGTAGKEYNYGSTNTITIDEVAPATELIDSVPVTIETADYTGKPLEEYSANLVLEVSVSA